MMTQDHRLEAIRSATAREIPLELAISAVLHHAAQEVMYAKMGAYHPHEDGIPTVAEELETLLTDVREIENHACDFGLDRDSCCGICGLDPRS